VTQLTQMTVFPISIFVDQELGIGEKEYRIIVITVTSVIAPAFAGIANRNRARMMRLR